MTKNCFDLDTFKILFLLRIYHVTIYNFELFNYLMYPSYKNANRAMADDKW